MKKSLSWLPVAAALVLSSHAVAQEPTSADLARQLSEALTARQMDAWATRDAAEPTRFVAALLVPGSQLLVISAKPVSPEALQYRLKERDYRQVYIDLQTAAVPAGRFFVQDMAADGFDLAGGPDATVDVVYENASDRLLLNGDWKGQNLTDAEYANRVRAAETRYATLLNTLLTSMRAERPPTTTAALPPAAAVPAGR